MSVTKQLEFTYQKFLTYLKDRPPRTILGTRGDAQSCPIACFFIEEHDVDFSYHEHGVCVSVEGIKDGKFFTQKLFPWSRLFMRIVDSKEGRITFGKAVKYMESAEVKLAEMYGK